MSFAGSVGLYWKVSDKGGGCGDGRTILAERYHCHHGVRRRPGRCQAVLRGGLRPAGGVRGRGIGRIQFTIPVDDVDATCAQLAERGVELLNGPMDRPWGIRTASFRDPGGHIWEIAR